MARECEHLEFAVHADVNRLTASDGGSVSGYAVDITINCAECGLPFAWRGLPFGLSPMEPRLSFDGLELRAPITPAGAAQRQQQKASGGDGG